jgi:hypothetical protein
MSFSYLYPTCLIQILFANLNQALVYFTEVYFRSIQLILLLTKVTKSFCLSCGGTRPPLMRAGLLEPVFVISQQLAVGRSVFIGMKKIAG